MAQRSRVASHDQSTRRGVLQLLGGVGMTAIPATTGCLSGPTNTDTPRGTSTTDTPIDEPPFTHWTYQTPHETFGPFTLGPTDPPTPALYVGSGEPSSQENTSSPATQHTLYALTLQEGSEHWQASLPHPPRTTPMHSGDDGPLRLYLATAPRNLYGETAELHALDPTDGKRVWAFNTENRRFVYSLVTAAMGPTIGRKTRSSSRSGRVQRVHP